MALNRYFNRQIKFIDNALDKYLPKADKSPQVIHEAMRYSVFSGGKRIRPILAIEACRLCHGKTKDVIVPALAIELIHTFSLIHDDLPAMDNDDYRRGKLTAHKKFGENIAVLAGDALLNLAFGLISSGNNFKKQNLIIRELSSAIGTSGMVGGQVADILSKDKKNTLCDINYINYNKTARFIASSLKIGAISAGAAKKQTDALFDFGASLGCIFQITDDILDNDGLAKLIGSDAARKEVDKLAKRAKLKLSMFGKNAHILQEITDFVVTRKK